MTRNTFKTIISCLIITIIIYSCEKATDLYLGIPLQPKFSSESFTEGMNIFGILRTDSIQNINKSFVYIETILNATEFTEFTTIDSAETVIYTLDSTGISDSTLLIYTNYSPLFYDSVYRPQKNFVPVAGKKYKIICKYNNYPDAIGETQVPFCPVIDEESVVKSDEQISFTIKNDTSIKMVDLYLIGNANGKFISRYITVPGKDMLVKINIRAAEEGMKVRIYGYDANLAAYYSNSNTSLNFNKFRTTYSTLTSGFGVFGSLNFCDIDL